MKPDDLMFLLIFGPAILAMWVAVLYIISRVVEELFGK